MNKTERLDLTRRYFFERAFGKAASFGIGSAALAGLMNEGLFAETSKYTLDFAPKAKSVIYLQQAGGPPHIDLFDYKPELEKRDGEPTPESLIKGERFAFITGSPKLQKSPFTFQRYGKSGAILCNLLPHLAEVVDDVSFVKSMYTTQFNHGPAQIFQMPGEDAVIHPRLMAFHPVEIAAQRIDLAIMGENPEGLRQRPGREGVGRIALVIDRET